LNNSRVSRIRGGGKEAKKALPRDGIVRVYAIIQGLMRRNGRRMSIAKMANKIPYSEFG
jgi:hypothetical protein